MCMMWPMVETEARRRELELADREAHRRLQEGVSESPPESEGPYRKNARPCAPAIELTTREEVEIWDRLVVAALEVSGRYAFEHRGKRAEYAADVADALVVLRRDRDRRPRGVSDPVDPSL